MNTLTTQPVAGILKQLFARAEVADQAIHREFGTPEGTEFSTEQLQAIFAEESRDYKGVYKAYAGNYLNVSPEFGRFLYMCVRIRKPRRVVEFGTSFGISAIHLASALRDNDRGVLIGTELEATKAAAARESLSAAGLADLVDIRTGDALETLVALDGEVELVHLDGAFSLYLPVLKLLEPYLQPGTLIIGENSFGDYIDYVRDPANGYLSLPLPFEAGRGNEFTVFTASGSGAS